MSNLQKINGYIDDMGFEIIKDKDNFLFFMAFPGVGESEIEIMNNFDSIEIIVNKENGLPFLPKKVQMEIDFESIINNNFNYKFKSERYEKDVFLTRGILTILFTIRYPEKLKINSGETK